MRLIFPILFILTLIYSAYYFTIGEPLFTLNNDVFGKHVIYAYDDTPIYVDLADTDEERVIGLGKREVMAASQGMLFKFNQDRKWRVWMKDMNFGIDILWLDKDGRVVDIKEFVYPDTYPESFEPVEDARYILEVITGFVSSNGITIGHKLDLNGY
jgi:uncharacterized membrane protein (UPF0127 family)